MGLSGARGGRWSSEIERAPVGLIWLLPEAADASSPDRFETKRKTLRQADRTVRILARLTLHEVPYPAFDTPPDGFGRSGGIVATGISDRPAPRSRGTKILFNPDFRGARPVGSAFVHIRARGLPRFAGDPIGASLRWQAGPGDARVE